MVVLEAQGHTPQVVGARMLVLEDRLIGTIGGGAMEREVMRRAPEVLAKGQPERVSFRLKAELGMCCGGGMEVLMEPIIPSPRVLLFGAGHVAKATTGFALATGLRVEIIDARTEWNTPERFGDLPRHLGDSVDHLRELTGPHDLLVIATHDHDLDKRLIEAALHTEATYIGMIGSSRKVKSTRRYLKLAGHADEAIDRVHMPIGLDILAETPEEIGLAITGELIRHHRAMHSTKQTRGASVLSMSEQVD